MRSTLRKSYDVAVVGAGVSGLATAYHLRRLVPDISIALITAHPPMSLTSSMSTECFRDHWPTTHMRDFMRRSIHLMEESSKSGGLQQFPVHRQGYLYVSKQPDAAEMYRKEAKECHGVDVRGDPSSLEQFATGADVFTSQDSLKRHFGEVFSSEVRAGMLVRNAGWVPAHTMGMTMLSALQSSNLSVKGEPLFDIVLGQAASVTLDESRKRISAVHVKLMTGDESRIGCGSFVNCAGPYLDAVHSLHSAAGMRLRPLGIHNEVHAKVIFRDVQKAVPRHLPMIICSDPIRIPWAANQSVDDFASVLMPEHAHKAACGMGSGAHFRAYGGDASDALLLLWESWHAHHRPSTTDVRDVDELLEKDFYPEVLLRGLGTVVPAFERYTNPSHPHYSPPKRSAVDGGYYTKTPENLPLIGNILTQEGGDVPNSLVVGALSGYGVMACHAAGELGASHIAGLDNLPAYAKIMSPRRYVDPELNVPSGIMHQLLQAGGGQL